MKKLQPFAVCLLIACVGWIGLHTATAQQMAAQPVTRQVASRVGITTKHLYLRGGRTHLVVQRTQTGTRVYRQVGNRLVLMR